MKPLGTNVPQYENLSTCAQSVFEVPHPGAVTLIGATMV